MKDKIMTLIIGILIGAILATGGFLIYNKINVNNNKMKIEQPEKRISKSAKKELPSDNKNSETKEKRQKKSHNADVEKTS